MSGDHNIGGDEWGGRTAVVAEHIRIGRLLAARAAGFTPEILHLRALSGVAMTANLLATKLHRPALPPTWVKRPLLTQRLQEGLTLKRQLTLVSTPAGSTWMIREGKAC